MVFLPDQTAVAVPHSTDPLSGSHLIHRTGGLLGYRLVISNRGINSVSDRITTIINRSTLSVPFNFPKMIETRYCEAAFMFCVFRVWLRTDLPRFLKEKILSWM